MLAGIRSRSALKAPKIIHEACWVVNRRSANAEADGAAHDCRKDRADEPPRVQEDWWVSVGSSSESAASESSSIRTMSGSNMPPLHCEWDGWSVWVAAVDRALNPDLKWTARLDWSCIRKESLRHAECRAACRTT
eukprot:6490726-Amphidinium_carterae.2